MKTEDCETCNGWGYVEVKCDDCDGAGKIEIKDPSIAELLELPERELNALKDWLALSGRTLDPKKELELRMKQRQIVSELRQELERKLEQEVLA